MDKLTKETLIHKYDIKIESAYCIVVKDHEVSEKMARRCIESCNKLQMPVKRWEAFDGTKGEIIVPEHLRDRSWLKWIKIVNEALALTEICCALSHFSLWAHCIELDRPIVVLEHQGYSHLARPDRRGFARRCSAGCRRRFGSRTARRIPVIDTKAG